MQLSLLAWLQGQGGISEAIVGIYCLVKGHLLSGTEPLKYADLNQGRPVRDKEKKKKKTAAESVI